MNQEQLQAIRERVNKATPGPWKSFLNIRGLGSERTYEVRQTNDIPITGLGRALQTKEDAEFIAHAREDVPALLDEIERLQPHNLVAQVDELLKLGVEMRREIERLQKQDELSSQMYEQLGKMLALTKQENTKIHQVLDDESIVLDATNLENYDDDRFTSPALIDDAIQHDECREWLETLMQGVAKYTIGRIRDGISDARQALAGESE